MNSDCRPEVESEALSDFLRVMQSDSNSAVSSCHSESVQGGRINLNPDNVKNGLAQLVLTLVKLLHELLERQAIRRIDAGSLSDQELESVGITLMRQAEELERLRKAFSLEEGDLNMDLGPLGKLL